MKLKSIVKLRVSSSVLLLVVPCLFMGHMILPAVRSQSSSSSGNLALGKPARMSSQYSGEFPAASGVDGKVDTMFHTDSERNPWWQVDLQQSYSLSYIMLRNRRGGFQERARSAQVLISQDVNSGKPSSTITEPISRTCAWMRAAEARALSAFSLPNRTTST